jgi:hypothetical protein
VIERISSSSFLDVGVGAQAFDLSSSTLLNSGPRDLDRHKASLVVCSVDSDMRANCRTDESARDFGSEQFRVELFCKCHSFAIANAVGE